MEDFAGPIEELHKTARKNRYEFLVTEADLVVSAIEFGTTELELGNREVAEKEAASASRGTATIEKFLPEIDTGEARNFIQLRLNGLRDLLEEFERLLRE